MYVLFDKIHIGIICVADLDEVSLLFSDLDNYMTQRRRSWIYQHFLNLSIIYLDITNLKDLTK